MVEIEKLIWDTTFSYYFHQKDHKMIQIYVILSIFLHRKTFLINFLVLHPFSNLLSFQFGLVPKDQYLGISCDPTLMVFQILLKLISKKMLDPFFSLGKSFDYLGSCAYFVCRPENLDEQITLCCCIISKYWFTIFYGIGFNLFFDEKTGLNLRFDTVNVRFIPVIISQILWGKKMVVK